MSVAFPWCYDCKNLIDDENKYRCKAFPDEIPSNVLFDETIREKENCNNGFKFEEKSVD